MRLRRPVVHHGAVALSSGSRYQARPALQSIPPVPAKRRGHHIGLLARLRSSRVPKALSRFAGRDNAPDVRGMQQVDVMVPTSQRGS